MTPNAGIPRRLLDVARKLGWRNLRRHLEVVGPGFSVPQGTTIVWYTSGHYGQIALQINERPDWRACVYAIPYRLCSGWHRFSLCENPDELDREVARLREWIDRKWFATRHDRGRYRRLHPECYGYDWDRVAAKGPPYM